MSVFPSSDHQTFARGACVISLALSPNGLDYLVSNPPIVGGAVKECRARLQFLVSSTYGIHHPSTIMPYITPHPPTLLCEERVKLGNRPPHDTHPPLKYHRLQRLHGPIAPSYNFKTSRYLQFPPSTIPQISSNYTSSNCRDGSVFKKPL